MDQDLQRGSSSCGTREVVIDTLSTTSRIFLFRNVYLNGGITAALRYCDVVDADGEIKAETTLSAAQTKGNKARKV